MTYENGTEALEAELREVGTVGCIELADRLSRERFLAREPKGYNGWSNYETWDVALWIGNDEYSYERSQEMARDAWMDAESDDEPRDEMKRTAAGALADALKEWIEEEAPEMPASLYSDLLNAALGDVDWYEIAENFLEDVAEGQPEDEGTAE